VSALGRGIGATYEALRDQRSGLQPCDFLDVKLNAYMGRVRGLETVSMGRGYEEFDCRNNRLALLGLQQDGFEQAVREVRERYGAHRIAVVIGTSTSGILETELAYRSLDPVTGELPQAFQKTYRLTHDTFSVARFVARHLGLTGVALVISTACSSSAKVFASAARLIEMGLCDAAVVGGVDSLCLTTLYGFFALGLMSNGPCRPCDAARDGLTIGEAAGFVLLDKSPRSAPSGSTVLLGYGESCDGYHMSHPHPQGLGAILAMQGALRKSRLQASDIDYVHLHGTATKTNDVVEDKAVSAVFGSRAPCSSTKGWTGHTLGAAGAVEAVIAALCLEHGLMPGTVNTETVDPGFTSRVLLRNQEGRVNRIMSNFFGFGGNNCSLIFGVV
jgi:3-oxoacyl-[acyl-carrier-protein] synthase I